MVETGCFNADIALLHLEDARQSAPTNAIFQEKPPLA
jgi:hypothetical protein